MLRPGRDKGIATPIPLGLAALGTTTFLMGVIAIFGAPASLTAYSTQALMFGGLLELLAGMWAFAYGDALAAMSFSFLGAFFGWWGFEHMAMLGIHAALPGVGMVFIVTGVVTLYMWIASFYETASFNLVLLFLWIAFGLMGIADISGATGLAIVGGISAIVSGLIAAYTSFAEIYNATSLEDTVPVGESKTIRDRAEHDEMERIRRTHPTDHVTGGAAAHA